MEALPILAWPDIGAGVLVFLIVLMILRGWLVPRATLVRADAESERWRTAYENERQARVTADQQMGKVLASAETTLELMRALQAAATRQARD